MAGVVAVTGAGGFIGSAAVKALHAEGWRVRAALWPPGPPAFALPKDIEATSFDIEDRGALDAFVRGTDAVVHAAGPPSVAASIANPFQCIRVHTLGTAAVLDACRRRGVANVVYISSAEVYGLPARDLVREEDPLQPRSPYGAAKGAAELIVRAFAGTYEISGYILRLFSVYGRGVRSGSLVDSITTQARSSNEIVVNDLKPVRDYCYVDDVAAAIACATRAVPLGVVELNIATGIGTSVEELARQAARIAGRVAIVREREGAKRSPNVEIYRLVADVSKSARVLGWKPCYDIERGLRAMMQTETVA